MVLNFIRWVLVGLFVCTTLGNRVPVQAQTFGIELHNNLMPASGGMGGVSIAQPQDVTSGINGNPASLTQFAGTQFSFGGAWAEPTFNMNQRAQIPALDPSPLIEPYSAKSTAPGVAAANIGVTQDFRALGLPATFAIGFITSSGALVDFRHVPESNATNAGLAVFSVPVAVGLDVTERLSLGTSMALGIGFFDGPFVGTGGMTTDYALRGVLGANYRLADCTTLGTYYQTQQSFRFDNAFIIDRPGLEVRQNVDLDLPQNVGFGIADHSLANGRFLVGIDVLYKMWDETDLFGAI